MSAPVTVSESPPFDKPASSDQRDEVDLHFAHRGHGLEFEMEARWVASQLPDNARRIADVGCGNGALFKCIGTGRVVGFDLSQEGLHQTRCQFPHVPIVAARAEELPVARGSLDAMVLQHVVEHLAEADRAVCEWRRTLRVGGTLVLLTPNSQFVDPDVYDDPTHIHIYDRRDLRKLVESCGFAVSAVVSLGLPWFRRVKTPGAWRLRRKTIELAGHFARVPGLRWSGQTLCCVARRVR